MKTDENRWVDLSNGVAWALIFSVAAIIMSICSLARSSERVLGFDYLGVIVGILALLVTFLVAWQIVQTLISREQLNGLNTRISAEAERAIHFNMYHIFLCQGQNAQIRNDSIGALDCYMRSLESAKKCELDDMKIDEVVQQILKIVHVGDSSIRPQINPKDCRVYEKIIKLCDHVDKDKIINSINECKSEEARSQVSSWTTISSINNPSKERLSWS